MAGSAGIQGMKRRTKTFAHIEPRIQRALAQIAETDFPLLLAGETGVGKRTVALQIHGQSHRSRGGFTEIQAAQCTAQSILSALSTRGTIYLAEIGDLNSELQGLIVEHYLQSEQNPPSRLLCGTSRELLEEVVSCRMREDFFHLVSAITLRISPLRCRKSEIPLIVDELLTAYSRQFDRPKPVLHDDILGFLTEYSWPGNLPELQTAIKTFVAIGDQSISLAALKAAASGARLNGQQRPLSLKEATRTALIQIERQLISKVLVATGGNRKRAANELGISYKALLYKLKQAGTEFQSASNGNGVAL
ncbi:MAG TPA: sigma 54-interacting transcriptional regulator [Acidobacteriaceae bacterium]|nr:sigma 54-interacting transcriptional regulator [Acidobacteriaceae bacterium]